MAVILGARGLWTHDVLGVAFSSLQSAEPKESARQVLASEVFVNLVML